MTSGTTPKLKQTDIEMLVNDQQLWRELQRRLASSKITTSMAVNEFTHQLLAERRELQDSDQTGKVDTTRKPSSMRLLGGRRSLPDILKKSRSVDRGIAFPLPSFRSSQSVTSVSSDENDSLVEDSLPKNRISITNLHDILNSKTSRKLQKSNKGKLRVLGSAALLSDELKSHPGFVKAFDNLSDIVEPREADEDLSSIGDLSSIDEESETEEGALLVGFPARPRSPTQSFIPPVAPTA